MKPFGCILLASALSTATAFSQNVIRDDFLVSSDLPGGANQIRSSITTTDGNVIVTWGDYRFADGAALLRVFNTDLAPISQPIRFIDAGFPEPSGLPIVAASPAGKFLAAYVKAPTAYAQLLDDRGNRIGLAVEMLTTIENRCYWVPLPVGLPDGSFAVAWTEERGPWQFEYFSAGLFIQKIGPDGHAESEPIALLPDSLSAGDFQMSVSPTGEILLAWSETTSGYVMGERYRGIWVQRFDSNLRPLRAKIKLTGDHASPYTISASSYGNVLLMWRTIEHGVDMCFAQLFGANGVPLTQTVPLDEPAPDGFYPIGSHFNTDESETLVWHRESRLHVRKMNQSGVWMSTEHVLPINDNNAITAFSNQDELYITWCAGQEDDINVFIQKFTAEGDSLTVRTNVLDPGMDAGAGDERWPLVTGNESGEYFIHWRDYRRGNDEYRGQRFDPNHQPIGANVRPARPDFVFEFRLLNDGSYLGYGYTRYEYATPVVMRHYGADWSLRENWQMLAAIPDIFSISIVPGGESAVVWKDKSYGAAGPILLQRFSRDGVALFSSPITVVDTPASDYIIRLHVFPDDTGNAIVLWGSWLDDHAVGTYSRFVTAGGEVSAPIVEVAKDVVLNSGEGNVAQARGGNSLMVWFDMSKKRLFGKLFDQVGAPIAEAFAIQDDSTAQVDPFGFYVTASARGFVVVWRDHREVLTGGRYSSIYAQAYSPNGQPLGGNFRVVNNDDYPAGSPTVLAQGEQVIFIWEDGRRTKGYDIFAKVVSFDWRGTAVRSDGLIGLASFHLAQNYPNPLRASAFSSSTTIRYDLPQAAFVSLEIYNLLGQKVRTLVSASKSMGSYHVIWNGMDDAGNALPSGVYFCRFNAGIFKQVRKLVLIR